jgi:hypothetical protein
MDAMKKATAVDYTSWDLNCPQYVHIRNRQKWEAKFKRKARRKDKILLKKLLTDCSICDKI